MDSRYIVGEEWIGLSWCDKLGGDGEVDGDGVKDDLPGFCHENGCIVGLSTETGVIWPHGETLK